MSGCLKVFGILAFLFVGGFVALFVVAMTVSQIEPKPKKDVQAKAAKGPYTVIFESGQKHTAGSYPELVKLTGIKYSTLQHRMTHKPEVFERGWKIYKGE